LFDRIERAPQRAPPLFQCEKTRAFDRLIIVAAARGTSCLTND
jgi:hypothetical protein